MLVAACAVLTALAWGRLAWTTATTASPAHPITSVRLSDGVELGLHDVTCHGPAYVAGADVWQLCYDERATASSEHLTRFDLAARRATLLPAIDGAPYSLRSISAVIGHPAGGLVVLADRGLLRVTHDAVTPWVALGVAWRPCLRFDGDALEVAAFGGGGAPMVARVAPDGATTRREGPPVAAPEGAKIIGAGCRWDATAGAWRFLWTQWPKTQPTGATAEVALLERGLDPAEPVVSQRLALAIETPESFEPYWFNRSETGELFLFDELLDRSPDGGISRWHGQPPLERRGGQWVAPSLPPGTFRGGVEADYVVTDHGLQRLLGLSGPASVRVGDGWIVRRTGDDRDAFLQRQSLDFIDQGPAGPPVTGVFWLQVGYKVLPAPQGGYWLMGGLGEAVVHVGDDLARTDGLGFIERLERALADDRAKVNSDFYLEAGDLRRFGFLWVLCGFVVLVVPLWLWARRRPGPGAVGAVSVASVLFLLVAVAAAHTFYKLSGVFW